MPGTDFLQLDPANAPAHGLADWLTAALRAGVADGRLPVGTRLPSTRGLADQLGVSRGVVVEAYQRLADEGLLGGRRGGGTTVLAATIADPHAAGREPARPDVEIDLSPGLPDLSAFPRQAWLRAERIALTTTAAGRARLRRPARHPGAARRPGPVAGPQPRDPGRPGRGGRGQRRGAGAGAAGPGAARPRCRARSASRIRAPAGTRAAADAVGAASVRAGPGRRRTASTSPRCADAGLDRRGRHPGPPVPDRRGARRRPAPGADRLDARRRPGRRGRLRRRAPLRPAAGRRPAGARARTASPTWAACPRRWRPRCGWAGCWPRRRCGRR